MKFALDENQIHCVLYSFCCQSSFWAANPATFLNCKFFLSDFFEKKSIRMRMSFGCIRLHSVACWVKSFRNVTKQDNAWTQCPLCSMAWKTKSNKSKWLSWSWALFYEKAKTHTIKKKHPQRERERCENKSIKGVYYQQKPASNLCVEKVSASIGRANVGRQKWNEMILKCT